MLARTLDLKIQKKSVPLINSSGNLNASDTFLILHLRKNDVKVYVSLKVYKLACFANS